MTASAPETAPTLRPLARWWWRPPAFAAGFIAIVAGLYLVGHAVYLDQTIAADREAFAQMRDRHVLLLGTSHGHDLSLADAGFDGVDLSHGGQDLFEMAYMARTVKKTARKLDTVFISLSYFSLYFDNAAYVKDGVRSRVGRRIDLYSIFGRMALIPGDSAEYVKGRLYPVVTSDHYRAGFRNIASLLTGHGALSAAPAQPTTEVTQATHRSRSFIAGHAKRRCKQFAEFSRNMSEHHPRLAEDSLRTTLELTRELTAASVRVVFFTPPYTRAYNACFDPDHARQTREAGQRFAREKGAFYYDFSEHPAYIDRLELFEDSDHLNEQGRAQFSRLLREHLDADSR